jgi:hypothetical protein
MKKRKRMYREALEELGPGDGLPSLPEISQGFGGLAVEVAAIIATRSLDSGGVMEL